MTTIIDVIENFFGEKADKIDYLSVKGIDLYRFGEEVRRYSAAVDSPKIEDISHPSYIGGWPSANFWDGNLGDLTLTSILFSGQILVKDPISDWYSFEQYEYRKLLASRQGFLDVNQKKISISKTRQFLQIVIPRILSLRSLIVSNKIVLMPSKKFIRDRYNLIVKEANLLSEKMLVDIKKLSGMFGPKDLAVADNVRGMFMLAGGNREKTIKDRFVESINYTLGEYLFSLDYGFTYSAAFSFETFFCQNIESHIIGPNLKIVNAMLNSRCSIFRGLTPELVSRITEIGRAHV